MPEIPTTLRLLTSLPASADTVVLGVIDTDGKLSVSSGSNEFDYVNSLLGRTDAGSALDSVVRIPDPQNDRRTLILTGLGSQPVTLSALRHAVGAAIRKISTSKSVGIAIPTRSLDDVSAICEGALLGRYAFDKYGSAASPKKPNSTTVSVITTFKSRSISTRSAVMASAVSLVKDLVNTPPNHLGPSDLATRAVSEVKGLPIRTRVWDEKQLARDGFGGILGVGQGSTRPPRLVRLTYAPSKRKKHIALVGKGITFDTGGLSLKPAASMLGMKYDMTGAATVLAIVRAVAQLELPVAVTAWMCIAENMPSGDALRPNDVLRMYGGKTVEVTNTDAEGRLVLADGLVAAEKENPDLIVDVATLTGAASVALGTRYAGVMGDAEPMDEVLESAAEAGDLLWPMPLPAEMRAVLNSDVADLMNAKVGNTAGGMLLGATFLREFVTKTPWVHLDVASCANNAGAPYGFTGAGPTGTAVRTLIRLAERMSGK